MRSTTSKLIFVAVAFAAVFARGADAAADAACDTALTTAYRQTWPTANAWRPTLAFAPLRARRPSRPPKTRARTRNGPTTPITRLRSGTTTRSPGTYTRLTSGRSVLDKQDACDAVIHDFLIASVKTCVQGFTLAATTSTDVDQLYYCTGGGGTDDSTCDAKCQAYIDIMDTTCDVGASYNAPTRTPSMMIKESS